MAAGLGFKEFTTGDVLTAADANGYLASQVVMVFADAAARTSAIASPQEGMIAYLKDTNAVEKYDGAAWVAVSAAGSSGLTLIARTPFSNVSSQAFDNVFTSSYFNYLVVIDDIFAATSSDDLQLQLRYAGPTTQSASYYGSSFAVPFSGSAAITASNNASQMTISAITGSSTTTASGHFFVNNVGNSSLIPNFRGQYTDSDANQISFGGQINVARTYTGFLLKSSSTNITGNVSIYGLAKA
jgi:hypothetical protein